MMFSLYVEDWKSGTFSELVVIGAFCRCSIAEKRISLNLYDFTHLAPSIGLPLVASFYHSSCLLTSYLNNFDYFKIALDSNGKYPRCNLHNVLFLMTHTAKIMSKVVCLVV